MMHGMIRKERLYGRYAGGAWNDNPRNARVSARNRDHPVNFPIFGVRVVVGSCLQRSFLFPVSGFC